MAPPKSIRTLKDPIYNSSATALAEAIRYKHISSEEITRIFLDRIAEVNPKINAVMQVDAERAIRQAKEADTKLASGNFMGSLHGVPITIKDSIDTRDFITTAGTMGRAKFIPASDATVVKRLKDAGAILLGKTNTPELTLWGKTENLIYGVTSNPYNTDHSPMGSSGGAAAIVSAGGSAFDIGSDTGGSIRIPAHCCGICGIRPTHGRVPRTGHIISYHGFDQALTTLGPMTRFVEDLDTVLRVISGPDGFDPYVSNVPMDFMDRVLTGGLGVVFYTNNGTAIPSKETDQLIWHAADAVGQRSKWIIEGKPLILNQALDLLFEFMDMDSGYSVNQILRKSNTEQVSPYMEWAMEGNELYEAPALSPKQFAEFYAKLNAFRSEVSTVFHEADIILCPVGTTPAPLLTVDVSDLEKSHLSYTCPYNIMGWPAAVVRIGTSENGLPVGIQIVGKPWKEHQVLAVAKFLEDEFGGFQPPNI